MLKIMELSNGKFSSVYLTEQINIFREIEGNKNPLLHKSLIAKIEKEFEEEIREQKFLPSSYLAGNGKKEKCYQLDFKDSLQMLVSESKTVRKAIIKRLEELEQRSKEPLLNTKIHLQRYELNKPNIPKGYFCMLKEVITEVIMELELEGKDLIDSAMPDGSLGIGFPKFLKEKGIDISGYPKYRQQLTNGKIVDARAYPYTVYHFFKEFVDIWIKDKGQKYFTEKTILLLNK